MDYSYGQRNTTLLTGLHPVTVKITGKDLNQKNVSLLQKSAKELAAFILKNSNCKIIPEKFIVVIELKEDFTSLALALQEELFAQALPPGGMELLKDFNKTYNLTEDSPHNNSQKIRVL